MIKVGVFGAAGRMGIEVCRAVIEADDLDLVAAIDLETKLTLAERGLESGLKITSEADPNFDVAVDFTEASVAASNIQWCLGNDVHAVVGTTGLTDAQIEGIAKLADGAKANVLIAPNFAIGAVLMMEFAKRAARFLGDAEIIELHHPGKRDAPSGTALSTLKGIVQNRRGEPVDSEIHESLPGARGGEQDGVRIHSVRLPGLVAHQEVIFGSQGQTLSIRHDSTDRTSFMPGVLLGIREIANHPGVTLGLENFIDADLM
jgi:4-hydroxy-tetrahydrodipicolinate reductase